jgi:HEAT repeat protein
LGMRTACPLVFSTRNTMPLSLEQAKQKLRDGDEEDRKLAAITLGKSGDAAAFAPLAAALNDPLRSVRRAAQDSLITLRDPRAVDVMLIAAAEGRLDFNPVAYALTNKFGVADAYPRLWELLQQHGDEATIEAAHPAYERWQQKQSH